MKAYNIVFYNKKKDKTWIIETDLINLMRVSIELAKIEGTEVMAFSRNKKCIYYKASETGKPEINLYRF